MWNPEFANIWYILILDDLLSRQKEINDWILLNFPWNCQICSNRNLCYPQNYMPQLIPLNTKLQLNLEAVIFYMQWHLHYGKHSWSITSLIIIIDSINIASLKSSIFYTRKQILLLRENSEKTSEVLAQREWGEVTWLVEMVLEELLRKSRDCFAFGYVVQNNCHNFDNDHTHTQLSVLI